MTIQKKKINIFFEYIIIFLIILESTSVYSNSDILPIGILSLLTIFVSIYAIFNIEKLKRIKKRKILIYIIYIVYILIFSIFSVEKKNYGNFFIKFVYLISIFYFYIDSIDDIRRMIKIYCNCIFALCFISLVFYSFGYILKILPINYNVILNWGYTRRIGSLFNLHFFVQTEKFLNTTLVRNTGIFCEAPMYMLNLTLCLTLSMFFCEKNKLRDFILIVGIISTFSSTGYIILIILFTLYFVSSKKITIKFLILPVILVISIFIIFNIIESKSDSRSYSVRYDDYVASIQGWKENIIFGSGYRNNDLFLKNISSFRSNNTGQSSSVGAILLQGGIYLFLLYFVSFLSIYKFNKKSKTFSIIYIILFILTVFQYTGLELLILSISINLISLKNGVQNEKI